jgi:uncharacterized membrane protein YphA (DoxX/SURF4 family)
MLMKFNNFSALDFCVLASRMMMSASMIRYGYAKLIDIHVFTDSFITKRFMDFFAHGVEAPLWFGYSNALFQFMAGVFVFIGFKARASALLLAIWLTVLTYFGHSFWGMEGGGSDLRLSPISIETLL